jgi:hypothetical protein
MSTLSVSARHTAEGRIRVTICAPLGVPPPEAAMEAFRALGIAVAKQHHSLQRLEKIAKRHVPKMKSFVLDALRRARAEHKQHGIDAALREFEVGLTAMPAMLISVIADSGRMAVDAANAKGIRHLAAAGTRMVFDEKSAESIAWAQQHAGELLVDVSDATRRSVKEIITRAQVEGLNADEQAALIADVIGLTERDANAVFNRRDELENDGTPDEEIDAEVSAYAEDLLEERADLIAVTETNMAANEGQLEAWDQAVENGMLPPDVLRKCFANDGCCDVCDDADGQVVGLDEPFVVDGEEFDTPPFHPRCRCGMGIADADEEPTDAIRHAAFDKAAYMRQYHIDNYERKQKEKAEKSKMTAAPAAAPAPSPPVTISEPEAVAPPAAPPSDPHAENEAALSSSDPTSMSVLSGGMNQFNQKVTLNDGRVGVFKAASLEKPHLRSNVENGQGVEREVAAWEVAKALGHDDIVSPTVERTINLNGKGERGSFQQWSNGTVAANLPTDQAYGMSKDDLARSALFDHVIGNTDRHSGNWMMQGGKPMMIDHGLAFAEKNGKVTADLGSRASHLSNSLQSHFDRHKEDVLGRRAGVEKAMRKAGLGDRQVNAMHQRMDVLGKSSSFHQLYTSTRLGGHHFAG